VLVSNHISPSRLRKNPGSFEVVMLLQFGKTPLMFDSIFHHWKECNFPDNNGFVFNVTGKLYYFQLDEAKEDC